MTAPRLLVALGFLLAGSAHAEEGERCVDYAASKKTGVIEGKRIEEASGLVASDLQTDLFWTHNDSGAEPWLYALDGAGNERARVYVDGADAVDWEDIALGRCRAGDDERACLFIADTGNNEGDRDDQAIYRVVEPEVRGREQVALAEVMFVAFERDEDVEALFVDAQAAIWLVGKDAKRTRLYRVGPFGSDTAVEAELVADRGDIEGVTGATATADATRVLLRSGEHAWELFRPKGTTMRNAFLGELLQIGLAKEKQGEAIALAPDGDGFFTTSEGKNAPIRWYRCKAWGVTLSGKADGSGITIDPAAASPGCRGGVETGWGICLLLAGRGLRAARRRTARLGRNAPACARA